MATISNTNVGPAGQVITTAAVDAKFTDIATATGTLDVNNVRSEGVDRRTLDPSRTEPVGYVDYVSNSGSAFPYTGQTGRVPFEVNHANDLLLDWTGSPVALSDGDLLRINFKVYFHSHTKNTYKAFASGATATASDSVGIIFYPVWDVGAGWSVLPNQINVNATLAVPPASGVIGAINSTTQRSDSIAWAGERGTAAGTTTSPRVSVHGTAYILHSGLPVQIERIRINCRGPIVYHESGGLPMFDAPNWANDPYIVPYGSGLNSPCTLNIGEGQLSAIIMRGDS